MRTIKTVVAGRAAIALRSDGNVYIFDRADAENEVVVQDHVLAATSAAGCDALADAFREIAIERRRHLITERAVVKVRVG